MGSRHGVLAVLFISALAFSASAQAADGDPDPTFGTGGRATVSLDPGSSAEGVGTLLPLSDGGFLTTGLGNGFGIWTTRNAAGGALLPPYGDGTGSLYQARATFTSVGGAALAPDGSLLISGHLDGPGGTAGNSMVERLTPAGAPDPTFGNDPPNPTGDGTSLFDFGGNDFASDVGLQGSLPVVAGEAGPSGNYDVYLVRLRADGSVDPAFGTASHKLALTGNQNANAVAINPDGSVVVAATDSSTGPFVARFTAGGSLDTSFAGGSGIERPLPGVSVEGTAQKITLDPQGRILIVGIDRIPDPADPSKKVTAGFVSRLLPDGSPDLSFGTGGTTVVDPPSTDRALYLNDIAALDDGRAVAVGAAIARDSSQGQVVVARLLPNGTLDSTWGGAGIRKYGGGTGTFDSGDSVAILPGRRILVGGATTHQTGGGGGGAGLPDATDTSDRLLLRLLGDTTAPNTKILGGPKGKIGPRKKVSFRFTLLNDTGATYECKLVRPRRKPRHRGAAKPAPKPQFKACKTPQSFGAIKRPGTYKFFVRAIDPAGNVDASPAKQAFRVKPKHKRHHR